MALNLVDIKTIYAEDPKLQEKDVKALVKWVQNQPHLPKIGGKCAHLTRQNLTILQILRRSYF